MKSPKKVLVIDLNDSPRYQRIVKGPPQTYAMRSGRVYLPPGQACGQHSTQQHEEMLIFLSGQGRLSVGEEQSFQVGQGKVIYIPPDTLHDVKNTGSQPLTYIYCVAPARSEPEQ